MRAIQYTRPGDPEVIEVIDAPQPHPGPGEVLIKVSAAGVNPVDVKIRAAGVDFGPIEYSSRPGWDVAGTVADTGDAVAGFAEGDQVYALARFPAAANTWAEYAVVPAADLAVAPANWTAEQQGAAPLAALTAWQGLDAAGLSAAPATEPQAHQPRVLVLGGAGGVGHLAIQLAKARGAYVIATASAAKHGTILTLGADEAIDYRSSDPYAGLAPVDHVFITVDDDLPAASIIKAGTSVVTITGFAEGVTERLHTAGAECVEQILVQANGPQLASITDLAGKGQLNVLIDGTYPFENADHAHKRVEGGRVVGKVVLTP